VHCPRFFIDQDLFVGVKVNLDKYQSHHLFHVLRAKKNSLVILFNGAGGEFESKIITQSAKFCSLMVERFSNHNNISNVNTLLGLCISKNQYMDIAIQKSVELGVSEIYPLISDYSPVKQNMSLFEKKISRWEKIMVSACEQCGRNVLAKIHDIQLLSEFVTINKQTNRFIMSMQEEKVDAKDIDASNGFSLLVGPEGGISQNEEMFARSSGYVPIKIGSRILRTETAVIASLACIQYRWGDMSF
jgi:16S rRNA (uracil1498-N3)-methyltransferase